MPSRANPTELLNQRMFYNACRRRAELAARPKPFPLQFEDRELFHVGAYVLALVGNAATVQLGFPSETYEWFDAIIAALKRTKSPLLKDAAFALAFMQRALAYLVGAVSPVESIRQRKRSWALVTGRKAFPDPFDDKANIAFKVFLYQNSVPDDWTKLGGEEAGKLALIRENLTPLGKVLVEDVTFVVNMLECNRYDVFLYLPMLSSLWRNPSVLEQMQTFNLGIDRRFSSEVQTRCRLGLFDFAYQAKQFDFLPNNSYWWLNVMANFSIFVPWCLPKDMVWRRMSEDDEAEHWTWYIARYLGNNRDASVAYKAFLEDVTKYIYGVYDPHAPPQTPLKIAYDPWFWNSVFALHDGMFRVEAFRALRSIERSIAHTQSALVIFVDSEPGLLNLADEFRLENTPELKALVESMAYVQLWAETSIVGMPSYFAEYEEVVAAFTRTMMRIRRVYASNVYDSILEKLIDPLPSDLKTRWEAALAKEALLVHDAEPSASASDSDSD